MDNNAGVPSRRALVIRWSIINVPEEESSEDETMKSIAGQRLMEIVTCVECCMTTRIRSELTYLIADRGHSSRWP